MLRDLRACGVIVHWEKVEHDTRRTEAVKTFAALREKYAVAPTALVATLLIGYEPKSMSPVRSEHASLLLAHGSDPSNRSIAQLAATIQHLQATPAGASAHDWASGCICAAESSSPPRAAISVATQQRSASARPALAPGSAWSAGPPKNGLSEARPQATKQSARMGQAAHQSAPSTTTADALAMAVAATVLPLFPALVITQLLPTIQLFANCVTSMATMSSQHAHAHSGAVSSAAGASAAALPPIPVTSSVPQAAMATASAPSQHASPLPASTEGSLGWQSAKPRRNQRSKGKSSTVKAAATPKQSASGNKALHEKQGSARGHTEQAASGVSPAASSAPSNDAEFLQRVPEKGGRPDWAAMPAWLLPYAKEKFDTTHYPDLTRYLQGIDLARPHNCPSKLAEFARDHGRKIIGTRGLGNKCLFNATSQCIWGHDGKAGELEEATKRAKDVLCNLARADPCNLLDAALDFPAAGDAILRAKTAALRESMAGMNPMNEIGDILALSLVTNLRIDIYTCFNGTPARLVSVYTRRYIDVEEAVPLATVELAYHAFHYNAICSASVDGKTSLHLQAGCPVEKAQALLSTPSKTLLDAATTNALLQRLQEIVAPVSPLLGQPQPYSAMAQALLTRVAQHTDHLREQARLKLTAAQQAAAEAEAGTHDDVSTDAASTDKSAAKRLLQTARDKLEAAKLLEAQARSASALVQTRLFKYAALHKQVRLASSKDTDSASGPSLNGAHVTMEVDATATTDEASADDASASGDADATQAASDGSAADDDGRALDIADSSDAGKKRSAKSADAAGKRPNQAQGAAGSDSSIAATGMAADSATGARLSSRAAAAKRAAAQSQALPQSNGGSNVSSRRSSAVSLGPHEKSTDDSAPRPGDDSDVL